MSDDEFTDLIDGIRQHVEAVEEIDALEHHVAAVKRAYVRHLLWLGLALFVAWAAACALIAVALR